MPMPETSTAMALIVQLKKEIGFQCDLELQQDVESSALILGWESIS